MHTSFKQIWHRAAVDAAGRSVRLVQNSRHGQAQSHGVACPTAWMAGSGSLVMLHGPVRLASPLHRWQIMGWGLYREIARVPVPAASRYSSSVIGGVLWHLGQMWCVSWPCARKHSTLVVLEGPRMRDVIGCWHTWQGW